MFAAVAVAVFHSYMQKHIKQLKDVEKLALRMGTKSCNWDSGFCPRRAQASLCMFKIVHSLFFFPPNMITTRPNHSHLTIRQLLLHQPFAGTNAYLHSFVPHTVHAWNLLPESYGNLPLQHFKSVNYIT